MTIGVAAAAGRTTSSRRHVYEHQLDQPLALVRVQDSSDVLFINYYLYPQPTRSYWNRSIYALSDPKTRPNLIVRAGGGAPQIVTYAQLRDFERGPEGKV